LGLLKEVLGVIFNIILVKINDKDKKSRFPLLLHYPVFFYNLQLSEPQGILKKNNIEKYLSSEQLFGSFRIAVINNSDAIPQYGEIRNVGDQGGDVIFIKK